MLDHIAIRKDFPILEQTINNRSLVYLDNAATTHKPQQVLDRIIEYYSFYNSNIHRGVHSLSERSSEVYENSRKIIQAFINAGHSREIIFTHGTTDAINLVASSFGEAFVREGDEILITAMEHHSNILPWQELCHKRRATLKIIPVDEHGALLKNECEMLMSSKTKLLACAYVSNVTGIINPAAEIIQQAHAHSIPVLIDAAQAVQHLAVDVQNLDCDFLVFSGHKMYAETGIGVLYAKEKWLDVMPPYQHGGGMIDTVTFKQSTHAELPLKFEAGTPNYVGAASLAAAIEYIEKCGLNNIHHHEKELIQYAEDKICIIDGVTLYGIPGNKTGSLSFNIAGIHHYDIGMLLDKMGIAVRTGKLCAEPLMNHFDITGTVRASFALYNSFKDIDIFISGVERARDMLA